MTNDSVPTLAASDAASPDFLTLLRSRERGKLKVYIGSFAGAGKTYRMLQEGHELRQRDVDVVVAFVETHGRADTTAQLRDLEVVARRRIEYHGITLEEMDLDAVIARAPGVALVDELAHTNVPGSENSKRWQDVEVLLEAGISVISAVNIQHIESLNDVVQEMLGVTVRETVPDWLLGRADQIVNLDISPEDLRQRLIEGKIYAPDKIATALANFFTEENLSTLRELALREVASSVDRRREAKTIARETTMRSNGRNAGRIIVAMSSDPPYTKLLLRKASRIAGRLNSEWSCVYVQTPSERSDRIDAAIQRRLVENIQAAQAMGAEVVKLEGRNVAMAIRTYARETHATLVIAGQSRRTWFDHLTRASVIDRLLNNRDGLDVLIVAFEERTPARH